MSRASPEAGRPLPPLLSSAQAVALVAVAAGPARLVGPALFSTGSRPAVPRLLLAPVAVLPPRRQEWLRRLPRAGRPLPWISDAAAVRGPTLAVSLPPPRLAACVRFAGLRSPFPPGHDDPLLAPKALALRGASRFSRRNPAGHRRSARRRAPWACCTSRLTGWRYRLGTNARGAPARLAACCRSSRPQRLARALLPRGEPRSPRLCSPGCAGT